VRPVPATADTAPVPSHYWGGAAALDNAATPDREVLLASGWASAKSSTTAATIEFHLLAATELDH